MEKNSIPNEEAIRKGIIGKSLLLDAQKMQPEIGQLVHGFSSIQPM